MNIYTGNPFHLCSLAACHHHLGSLAAYLHVYLFRSKYFELAIKAIP